MSINWLLIGRLSIGCLLIAFIFYLLIVDRNIVIRLIVDRTIVSRPILDRIIVNRLFVNRVIVNRLIIDRILIIAQFRWWFAYHKGYDEKQQISMPRCSMCPCDGLHGDPFWKFEKVLFLGFRSWIAKNVTLIMSSCCFEIRLENYTTLIISATQHWTRSLPENIAKYWRRVIVL